MRLPALIKLLALALTISSAGMLTATAEESQLLDGDSTQPPGLTTGSVAVPASASRPVTNSIDPASVLAPPPINITGPEDLSQAVEQARSISHPSYKEKIRYQRTTHLSFPLPSVENQDMSQASVSDVLSIKRKDEAEEKKAALEYITSLVDQDRRKLQNSSKFPIGASSATINETVITAGSNGRVEVTVHGR